MVSDVGESKCILDLTVHFMCWCSALQVDRFEKLCHLIVLEPFKNSTPEAVLTHVDNQKVTTVAKPAVTHKHASGVLDSPGSVVGAGVDNVGSSLQSGTVCLTEVLHKTWGTLRRLL